jgi:subtilase family serine protease
LATRSDFALTAKQDRVGEIDNNSIVPIRGNVRVEAQPQYDHGRVADSFRLPGIVMVFRPAPGQSVALSKLLGAQLDQSSPSYHHWLTPEEFADRFGLSQGDLARVVSWLNDQGFTIDSTARGRRWVSFSGTAAQVTAAFHTEIHRYAVKGELRYANAGDPYVPAALAAVVQGFRGLDDFRPQPRAARWLRRVAPIPEFTSSISGKHYLAPNDFATIYGMQGLYAAGLTGSGETIAVMGQTDFQMGDIEAFRDAAGLSPNNPSTILVPGSPDPGTVSGDLIEADLDLEWSGALAPAASILYVNSNNAFTSLEYGIDEDLAPVLTVSYGVCEAQAGTTFANMLADDAMQANSQGMTLIAASGDDGAADCDTGTPTSPPTIATQGLAVDIPAAIPYFTGIGGTEFVEGAGAYWNATNNTQMGSAISYIPESVWNETTQDGVLAAGGGGVSTLFAKPTWQVGPGVPDGGQRDVPDISFNASADHDPYLICTSGSCVNGFREANEDLQVVGGTSAGAPSFAAIMALIDQEQKAAQGNVNPTLYSVATKSLNVFHDVTTGNNDVPCEVGTPDCPNGGQIGYSAGSGYDLASGLGSINAFNLASEWSPKSTTPPPDFQISINPGTVTLNAGSSGTATITITPLNGFDSAVNFTVGVPSTLAGVTAAAPTSVTGSGTTTLTITAASTARLLPPGIPNDPGTRLQFGFLLFAVALGVFFLRPRPAGPEFRTRRDVQARLWLALALLCLLSAGTSCGGGSSSATSSTSSTTTPPPETAEVTVQATSGILSHSVTISVTVN